MSEIELRAEIAALPRPLQERFRASGFDPERLARLAAPLQARARGEATLHKDERNRIAGLVEPPRPGDIADALASGSLDRERFAALGAGALARGELAVCVMAGGMATRMGGVVKALVEALDGRSFLRLRLDENATLSRRAGTSVPLWLMTSEATDGPIREELARRGAAAANVRTFTQDVGLRLTPEGQLLRGDDGAPSTYATGHGDLPDALRRSGLLADFIAHGGKYVWIANLDNLGATVDLALLGWFTEQKADVMVEVASKVEGDRGGIPVWADARDESGRAVRRLQVLEEFRLPKGFDAAAVRVFNTNTFLVRAPALERVRVEWNWFEVEKTVGGRVAVQFERLLQELTTAMPSTYVRVPRDGPESRFLPVKDHDELAKRRADIRAVAAARGMISG